MSDTGTAPARFDIGRVASQTFTVVRRNLLPFLPLGAIAAAPNAYFTLAIATKTIDPKSGGPFLAAAFGALLVGFLFTIVMQTIVTQRTIGTLSRQPTPFGSLLAMGLRQFFPLLAINLMEGIALTFGLLLLIVPGLMLFAMWLVVAPARIVEGTGIFASFSRSASLTSGYRWPAFGTIVVYYIGAASAQFSVRPAAGVVLSDGVFWAYIGIDTLVGGVVAVGAAVVSACIYYELRVIKEGVGPEQVADVFG